MRAFKDRLSREWSVEINIGTLKRVRGLLNINLLDVVGGQLLETLATDPEQLCNVLYVICKPQADAKGITDEQFGEGMAGDAISSGTDALLEELADFFPQPRRGLLQTAIAKLKTLDNLAVAEAGKLMASDKLENSLREKIATLSAGNSPASSEPIQTT